MDESESDVPAYMTFPKQHWAKLHSTNPIERRDRTPLSDLVIGIHNWKDR
jgi:transposase-like protein